MKNKIALLVLVSTLLALTVSAEKPRKINIPTPQIRLEYVRGNAQICLSSYSEAVRFELQRKSGTVFRRWRTIGFASPTITKTATTLPCWQDAKPPSHSRWRARGIGADGGRSPFSEAIP